jgi:hypothetical protein
MCPICARAALQGISVCTPAPYNCPSRFASANHLRWIAERIWIFAGCAKPSQSVHFVLP